VFYKTLQEKFFRIVKEKDLLDNEVIIKTRILKPAEAIGKPDRDDFPLLKGREVLMEATFLNVNGQAYTDAPSEFAGPLSRIIDLPLDDSRQKALFVAALNAVMRYVYPDLTTIHCKDNEPEECAREIVNFLRSLNPGSLGLIGLQPAILASLVNLLGAHGVLCVDRDEKNCDMVKSGISINWGDKLGMETLFKQSDLILATGSTVVNGTLEDILSLAEDYHRSVYFYGTTIAGTAFLMDLNRLCFKSR